MAGTGSQLIIHFKHFTPDEKATILFWLYIIVNPGNHMYFTKFKKAKNDGSDFTKRTRERKLRLRPGIHEITQNGSD